jgi:flavin-dependent dehydrogenase
MSKVSIIGSGPAGLSAAINLAREGFQISVYERNQDVGQRFNGDFQGLENWTVNEDVLLSFKNMNIKHEYHHVPFESFTLSNGDRFWDFKLDRPAFYLVKRGAQEGSLDYGLKEQALDLGVEINFNGTLPEERADIIATGPTAREKFAVARGAVFETDMDDMAMALVNDHLAFKGYSYLLINGGSGTISTVLFRDFHLLKHCFQNTVKIFRELTDFRWTNIHHSGGMGSFSNENTFERGGRLYVGEAAGIQDLLWGFGIRSAVTSGFLAAKALIHHENYPELAENEFRNKLKSSMVNRFLWEISGNYSWIVDRIHGMNDPLDYVGSFHKFNWMQRLLYPLARFSMKRRYVNLKL